MDNWNEAALILVGHGSSRNPNSRIPTCRLAADIRRLRLFAEVHECFLKEPPFAGEVLDSVRARTAFVVPNFAGHGQFTRRVIPEAMGLTGRRTVLPDRPLTVFYAAPVGCHPRVAPILLDRVRGIAAGHRLAAADTCLLLVGHGSSRPGGAAETAEAVAAAMRELGWEGEVALAFLEQEPFVADWRALTAARHVIVAPLLIAEGLHGSEDLPPLFGLKPGDTGPADTDGRRVWLCRGIGSDPEIVDLILDQVRACFEAGLAAGASA